MGARGETDGRRRILCAADTGRNHVNPLIAVAAELAARGVEDLWFACGDKYRAAVEAVDHAAPPRFVPLCPDRPEQDPATWSDAELGRVTTSSPLRNLAAVIDLNLDFEHRRRQYLRMLEIVDAVRPTLAVVDLFSSWAIDALTMRRIPYVALCAELASSVYFDRLPRSYPTPMSGLRREMSPAQRVHNVAFRMGRRLVGFRPGSLRGNLAFYRSRVAEGQCNPESKLSQYADEAIAVFSCSVFGLEYPFPRIPANLRMIGTMLGPRSESAADRSVPADWLDLHESVVYVSFGPVMRPSAQQVEAVVRAARRIAPVHQVLWELPQPLHHLLPPDLPGNLRVESEVPSRLDTLAHPHVRVFFNHGAADCVHEGLYFGKPQLVLPFWMNDVDNAARIRDSGAGLALTRRQNTDGRLIADRLRLLLSEPSFGAHAREWQGRLRAAGGSAAAADSIVKALDRIACNPA
ncbi:glycosyltransferase [Streptomyces sp. NBC_01506]|uniref:glycosyltransferase n=1 Tax=Streptomyces sp. NBC_01506 TaxID=2903887 RepID=UPI00386E9D78